MSVVSVFRCCLVHRLLVTFGLPRIKEASGTVTQIRNEEKHSKGNCKPRKMRFTRTATVPPKTQSQQLHLPGCAGLV